MSLSLAQEHPSTFLAIVQLESVTANRVRGPYISRKNGAFLLPLRES